MRQVSTALLIAGGGLGGVAAALVAARSGVPTALTESTNWLGGVLTSQAVPPDEHLWIEQFGSTATYRRFRAEIRRYYRDHFPLTPQARDEVRLNPGAAKVSGLCHEPRVSVAVIDALLAPLRGSGVLRAADCTRAGLGRRRWRSGALGRVP